MNRPRRWPKAAALQVRWDREMPADMQSRLEVLFDRYAAVFVAAGAWFALASWHSGNLTGNPLIVDQHPDARVVSLGFGPAWRDLSVDEQEETLLERLISAMLVYVLEDVEDCVYNIIEALRPVSDADEREFERLQERIKTYLMDEAGAALAVKRARPNRLSG